MISVLKFFPPTPSSSSTKILEFNAKFCRLEASLFYLESSIERGVLILNPLVKRSNGCENIFLQESMIFSKTLSFFLILSVLRIFQPKYILMKIIKILVVVISIILQKLVSLLPLLANYNHFLEIWILQHRHTCVFNSPPPSMKWYELFNSPDTHSGVK